MARKVTCSECGAVFPLEGMVNYRMAGSRKRYVCRSCARRIRKENNRIKQAQRMQYNAEKQQEKRYKEALRLQTTGMKQSKVAMVFKILIGILLLIFGFLMIAIEGSSASATGKVGSITGAITMAVGLCLFLWGYIPRRNAKKRGF